MTFLARPDRALTLRESQLHEALELLTAKHGAQSETVAVIKERLDDVQEELSAVTKVKNANHNSQHGDIISVMGGPSVKDAASMFVIIGGVLIMALGGMSTMFVLMMAAKW